MFSTNDRDLKQLEADLGKFAKRAIPFATRNTLNSAAFAGQKLAKANVRGEMTLRNRFTEQSIRVEQTRSLTVSRQEAILGSTADYMETQEFGGIKRKQGKHGVAIATSYSAGQGDAGRPRTRLPRKPNKLANIQLKRRRRDARSRKQQNFIAIKQAAASTNKYVFLDLGRRQGIFKVIGGKRKPKLKMVQDLSSETVAIPRNPWLRPAVLATQRLIPELHRKSLEFQARRLGLFKGR